MPNHCYNLVTITGPGTADLKKKLGNRTTLKKGLLHTLLPVPAVVMDNTSGGLEGEFTDWFESGKPEAWTSKNNDKLTLDSEYKYDKSKRTIRQVFKAYEDALTQTGFTSWYNWCRQTWGSKWGFYDTEVKSFRKDRIEFKARSAWCPPCEGLKTLSKAHNVDIEIKTTEEFCSYSFVGNYLSSGLAIEEELPGYMTPGSFPNLDKRRFDLFKDLIKTANSEDDDRSWVYLEEMSYKEYLEWNKDVENQD